MAWADDDYGYKKKGTIQFGQVNGDETDFPVLVNIVDADLKTIGNGGHVQNNNGYDIIFYDSTETVLLDHEIEEYNAVTGEIVMWVKIPSLSSVADTDIYMYYGNAGIGADPSTTDTWDSDFLAVWHLANLDDSTANGYDLTNNGATLDSGGKIHDCYDLELSESDYLYNGTLLDDASSYSQLTFENWIKLETTGTTQRFQSKANNGINYINFDIVNTTRIRIWGAGSGVEFTWHTAALTINDNAWHYCAAAIKQNDEPRLHLDAASATEPGGSAKILTNGSSYQYYLGRYSVTAAAYLDGKMDEARLSKTQRSDNWLKTTYNTQNDPDTFIEWGVEESPGAEEEPCGIFYVIGENETISLVKPLWGNINNKIMKFIDRKSFWSGNYEINDEGIDNEPLILHGWSKSTNFAYILAMQENEEEVDIYGLGDCIDATYIIRKFTFNTLDKTPNWFEWTMTLEKVRD